MQGLEGVALSVPWAAGGTEAVLEPSWTAPVTLLSSTPAALHLPLPPTQTSDQGRGLPQLQELVGSW